MIDKENESMDQKNKIPTFSVQVPLEEINITNSKNQSINDLKNKIIAKAFKFHSEGNIIEASKYYQYFLDQGFNNPLVLSNYGLINKHEHKIYKAIELFEKSISLFPNSPDAYSNLCTILINLERLKEAKFYIEKAISIKPDYYQAHYNLGVILIKLNRLEEAESHTRKSITINPNFVNGYENLGTILNQIFKLNHNELNLIEALKAYEKAIEIDPTSSLAKAGIIEIQAFICDWSLRRRNLNWLENLGITGLAVSPMIFMSLEDKPMKHLIRARRFYKQNIHLDISERNLFIQKERNINRKIRIGYFSANFCKHPVMILMARVFELHDKSNFEVFAYSLRNRMEDSYTKRVRKTFNFYRELGELSDKEAIQIIKNDKLDIAIDLMGHTRISRMTIFANRIAPTQISYLDYPGSTGADCIDYLIADKNIIPEANKKFYSEKIIYMPNSLQCIDDTLRSSKKTFTRKEIGLKEDSFVFCNFANNYKISEIEFNIWMKLLIKVENSILWLLESNSLSKNNLINEARKRGVDESRIIFSSKMPIDLHMSRQKCADLFLDTFNYNSGLMTFLALRSGLPVLTCSGNSFSARISTSILSAINMNDLIAKDKDEYERIAFEIATTSEKHLSIKHILKQRQLDSTYFNSETFTRDLEEKYQDLISI
ncbi:tetratricopeptide repeat protein [Prochlorococcus marinus]|uniref:protein O-GlcNAc transferase n=1 Tax=Prochlorococcus marinus XMU1408 TaxID=2213228 RepID=A0A318R2P9_PROMR|nr:tetratricopeptide repeat protein [Prochlorococcus marinus]PYE01170.1 hypothetical protein DNJ73_07010 [Prochlorococcus marinus XMU1408]